jgi:hypothetical protein
LIDWYIKNTFSVLCNYIEGWEEGVDGWSHLISIYILLFVLFSVSFLSQSVVQIPLFPSQMEGVFVCMSLLQIAQPPYITDTIS